MTERTAEIVLRLDRITKRFGGLVANDGISFELRRGEVLALLGENGAGKTTLMNIVFGHYVADEGEVEAFGRRLAPGDPAAALRTGIGMVHQHFMLADNLGVLDNIILGTEPLWRPWSDRRAARARLAALGQRFGLGVDPDAPVSRLSVGERQRVEILKALFREARILILDEPTAVLTPQESESLFDTLKKLVAGGLSILFISHKMSEVLRAADRVAVLRHGRLVLDRPAAGVTAAELAEAMVGRSVRLPVLADEVPTEEGSPALPTEPEFSQPVLSIRDAVVDGPDGRPALTDLSLELAAGEIVGIAGVSGNGQSALADLLSGLARLRAGRLTIGGVEQHRLTARSTLAAGIGRIPEDRHATGVVGDMSVAENAVLERHAEPRFSAFGFLKRREAAAHAARIIEAFDVRGADAGTRTRLLSGGNMQKLILGRVLAEAPAVILASQPTRGLDVGAVAYVHERLLAARRGGAGILLISEDLEELFGLADRIAVIHRGRLGPALPRSGLDLRSVGLMMAGANAAEALNAA